jgi:hypothetical protein
MNSDTQLYVLAEAPPSRDGVIAPVHATNIHEAIDQLQQVIGAQLIRLDDGRWTDGIKHYFLFFGEEGAAQFASLFSDYIARTEPAHQLMTPAVAATIPALYAQELLGMNAIARVKFFTPDSSWTW